MLYLYIAKRTCMITSDTVQNFLNFDESVSQHCIQTCRIIHRVLGHMSS